MTYRVNDMLYCLYAVSNMQPATCFVNMGSTLGFPHLKTS